MNPAETAVRQHFETQARACDGLGSPFTAALCRALATRLDTATATGTHVLGWHGDARADALALRLCGALHALVLTSADPALAAVYPPAPLDAERLSDAAIAAISRHDARVLAFLASPPQTNETGRAAMLLPGFLLIARETGLPLFVNEIGASAGLGLFFDRFRYDYGAAAWGAPDGSARLSPEIRGRPPLDGDLRVSRRAGCDIAPIQVSDPEQRLRLKAFVWPDQPARLQRLDAAMRIASTEGIAVERADAADFTRRQLALRKPGEAFVLFHSIMWQYMPRTSKEGVLAALDAAGREATPDAPIARLRMEPLGEAPHATLSLTMWPGGGTRRLARCDYHGRWIDWIG